VLQQVPVHDIQLLLQRFDSPRNGLGGRLISELPDFDLGSVFGDGEGDCEDVCFVGLLVGGGSEGVGEEESLVFFIEDCVDFVLGDGLVELVVDDLLDEDALDAAKEAHPQVNQSVLLLISCRS
jgi:hypothetical protein